MSAAPVAAIHRRRLIRRFREAGATDREHAVTLEALGERQSRTFHRMARVGVFLTTSDGRYFMDDAAATEYRHRCRIRALVGTAICLLLFLVLWLAGLFRG